MNNKAKRIVGGVAIGAALIAVLSMGGSLAYSQFFAKALPTAPVPTPQKTSTVSPSPTQPAPASSLVPVSSPASSPPALLNTPAPAPAAATPLKAPALISGSSQFAAGPGGQISITPEEAIRIFERLNSPLVLGQIVGPSSKTLALRAARADRYCLYYDVTFLIGTAKLDLTFALLKDTSGFYTASSLNQKAAAQLQSYLAGLTGTAGTPLVNAKPAQEVLARVDADTAALGLLQSIYTGPVLTASSGTGLAVSSDLNADRCVYTLAMLSDSVATAATSVTLPLTLKGCDIADKNNALALGLLESSIAVLQNQATPPAEASRLSLRELTNLQDLVKRALYTTVLKRWFDPICRETLLSQEPSRFPATGTFVNSFSVKGNSLVADLTSAVNVLNPDGSNSVYTARTQLTDALNQVDCARISNANVRESLYSEILTADGYRAAVVRSLYQIVIAADEHVSDLIDQQLQVPFPLRHSTGQVYKGPLLLQDPKTRTSPHDGLQLGVTEPSTPDFEATAVRYCKNGAVADSVFWIAKTPQGVDEANAHEIQEQADLKIYAIKFPSAAIDDLLNIHAAIVTQNNNVKKSAKNLLPVAPASDELIRLKTQKIVQALDPDMPVLAKNDPRPNGANGVLAAKDFQISSDGSYLSCYLQFFYRDSLLRRDAVEIDFQLPITEYGRSKMALPTIQALIKNPPATLPADSGITSLSAFLIKIQDYVKSSLVPANIFPK